MKVTVLATLSLLGLAAAQDFSSLPQCATSCALTAVTDTGCSPTDADCVCGSEGFLTSVDSCIRQPDACSESDIEAALQFARDFCGDSALPSSSGSASASGSATEGASSSATASEISSSLSEAVASATESASSATESAASATGTGTSDSFAAPTVAALGMARVVGLAGVAIAAAL